MELLYLPDRIVYTCRNLTCTKIKILHIFETTYFSVLFKKIHSPSFNFTLMVTQFTTPVSLIIFYIQQNSQTRWIHLLCSPSIIVRTKITALHCKKSYKVQIGSTLDLWLQAQMQSTWPSNSSLFHWSVALSQSTSTSNTYFFKNPNFCQR